MYSCQGRARHWRGPRACLLVWNFVEPVLCEEVRAFHPPSCSACSRATGSRAVHANSCVGFVGGVSGATTSV
eukprot:1497196-Pyramimonas_sp.AAC.1